MTTGSRRFLLTLWDGGGNVPPELGVARRVVERGHLVHVVGDPTIADAAEAAGCSFASWERAPHRRTLDPSGDLLRDWEADDPLDALRRLRDELMSGPAAAFAADTAAAIGAFRPDALLADTNLLGSVIAAEEVGLPVAVVVPNIWEIPTPGTGDPAVLRITNRVLKGGLPGLNAARAEHGLPPLTALYDQVLGADRILVLSSETFDTVSPFVPANVRYVGPVLDDPSWSEPWSSPWPASNTDPLVLVGFSSMYQDQGALVQRVIDALSGLQVRAVVALGRMLPPGERDRIAQRRRRAVRSAQHPHAGRVGGGLALRARDDHEGAGRRRAHGLHPDGARPGRDRRPRCRSGRGSTAVDVGFVDRHPRRRAGRARPRGVQGERRPAARRSSPSNTDPPTSSTSWSAWSARQARPPGRDSGRSATCAPIPIVSRRPSVAPPVDPRRPEWWHR